MPIDADAVLKALSMAWSPKSARQWTRERPANGQCNVTTLLIENLFGGEILKTPLPAGDHFYNRIDGARLDFTASQFDNPMSYADMPANRKEAAIGVQPAELAALTSAFQFHFSPQG